MKVFISSTFRDLKEEREKLHLSLKKAGIDSIGMEFFVAESNPTKKVCLREIEKADLVVLIIANEYGTKDEETGKSYTHLEFLHAKKNNKDILAFFQVEPKDEHVQKFQDEVKSSGITPDYFENKYDIPWILWPALIRYKDKNNLIINKTNTFNYFDHFYARYIKEDSVFNYRQKLIGRESELNTLEQFLSDTKQQIAIISAAGGIGKSKLIYEFALSHLNQTDWNFRFVPYQVGFDNNSISELPAQKTCVIIEDAHKQNNLDQLIYNLFNNFPCEIKVIITTRPSGIESIKQALREYKPPETINLASLSRDDSILLAKSILKDDKKQYAEAIHKASSGNTLVIVIASELIEKGKLNGSLIEDSILRDNVLEKILEEINNIDTRGIDLKELLATLAGLSPFINEEDHRKLLCDSYKLEQHKLLSIIEDFEKFGFIVQIGNRLRVIPDILADYLLKHYSVYSKNQTKGFIESLKEKYGNFYFANLLANISELEYQTPIKISNSIWAQINEDIANPNLTLAELGNLLDTIKRVAYYSPDKVYAIISKILEGKVSFNIDENPNTETCEIRQIINSIISVLSELGHVPDFTKRACLELWKISTEKHYMKFFDNFSESPLTKFKKFASFDNNNWFSVQNAAIDTVKEIINNNQHEEHEKELSEIIESSLKPEIENQSYSRRALSMSWFCAYDIPEDKKDKIVLAREKAFQAYSLLIDKSQDNALVFISEKLIQKMRMPYLKRNEVPEKAKNEFEREAVIANTLLQKIINKHIPILNNYIYEQISHREEKLLDNIRIEDVINDSMKSDYELFYCIRHNWPQDYSDDFDEIDKQFQQKQEHAANQLWLKCNHDPERLLDLLAKYHSELDEYNISYDSFVFLKACAKTMPELCSNAINTIIAQNKDDFFAKTISIWLQHCPKYQQYVLSKKILEYGNTCHKISLASSLTPLTNLSEDELIELIEYLSKDNSVKVKEATIRGLGITCYHRKIENGLSRIIKVLCDYDTQNDQQKLELLLDNFHSRWIPIDRLSETNISQLLNKIKYVKRLENLHDTGVFLSSIVNKSPLRCVKLFLWRIQNLTGKDEQPFPYNEGFREKPKELFSNPEYPECIAEILKAMQEYDWKFYFWCPTIVQWLDPIFSDKTQEILLRNIHLHKNVLRSITYIFVGYERDFFFNNIDFINKILVESSELQDKETNKLIQSKLLFMPFSGTRCISGLGEHDTLCLNIINECKKILEANPDFPYVLKDFYETLIKDANSEDEGKLNRDKAELQEEELGC